MAVAVPILVIGGNSRMAQALRPVLPPNTRYLAREAGAHGSVAVGDYGRVRPDMLVGAMAVINCTGLSHGDAARLHRANVDTAVHLAGVARDAGVARFVHLSSFSVLGDAPLVGRDTPAAPRSDYGRSKLAAERALLALEGGGFAIAAVRLPAVVGGGGRDKLERLIGLWARTRYWPMPRRPVRRSMIGVRMAARVLAHAAAGERCGVVYAADPAPFTYRQAAEAISAGLGRRVRACAVPAVAMTAMRALVPGFHASLYADSLLADEANIARGLPSELYGTIAAMARRRAGR